jgi:Domain of unknown function (DUF1707)
MTGRASLRASDADREQVADRLRHAATEGRLHDDELEERLGAALSARTYGELAALVVDLPAPAPDHSRRSGMPVRWRPGMALALPAAVILFVALTFTGGGHPHGGHEWTGGGLIWLVWIAIALRLFLHRRRGAR